MTVCPQCGNDINYFLEFQEGIQSRTLRVDEDTGEMYTQNTSFTQGDGDEDYKCVCPWNHCQFTLDSREEAVTFLTKNLSKHKQNGTNGK